MINYKIIGARIKAARKNSNMTQEKLAELLSVTPEHMSRLETGSVKISLEMLDKISEIFQEELESFLFGIATKGHNYLDKELSEYVNQCSSDKVEAIVNIAKIISKL